MSGRGPKHRSTICCVTDKIEKLERVFHAFRDEVGWCVIVFETHQRLFQVSENTELLDKVSGSLFRNFSAMSQESFFMVCSRLLDPAASRGNSNLSVQYIVSELEKVEMCTDELKSIAQELQSYKDRIAKSRNKLLSHRDVKTVLYGLESNTWSIEEVRTFIRNLKRFEKIVANLIGAPSINFSGWRVARDIDALMQVLNRGKLT